MDATPSVALPANAGSGVSRRQPPAPMRIGARTFTWGERTYVMGIVNVTPDSFSGDGLLSRRRDTRGRSERSRRRVRWSMRAPT